MAQQQEDPEKRLHSIMDKLFHYPKSTLSSSLSSQGTGGQRQVLGGKKRPNPSSSLAVQPEKQHCLVAGEAPLCRPWNREDLLRRLSTFKSMTWFAKPKVISAVNCARRGWVNVDMDIIACESCGARLLFSTPPSWTLQQVEKAASVFSLKLESGHKLLCPWIDNACDERLAEFPPTMPADLVDKFRQRSYLLFQLSALPLISSSAIVFMRSPQLEEFLRQPLMMDSQKGNIEFSQLEAIEDGYVDSAKLYYQAQKLISLCGWEPRSLPYVVDCKDGPNQFVKDADILNSFQGVDCERNLSLSFLATDQNENLEANKDFETYCGLQCDPKSVVLDCKLCGASVGLWAFSTVQRSVEFFRLVGYAEVNPGAHVSGHETNAGDRVVAVASNGESLSMDSNLKMTIAGGPPPTRQSFKATISLPVIGQSLRARLSYDPEFRDQIHNNQQDIQAESDCNRIQGEIDAFNDMRSLNSKKDDQVNCNSTRNDQSSCSNHDPSAGDDISGNLVPLEGTRFPAEEVSLHTGTYDSNVGDQVGCSQNVVHDSCQSNNFPEKVEDDRSSNLAVKDPSTLHVEQSSLMVQGANSSPSNAGVKDNESLILFTSEKGNSEQIAETDKACSKEIILSSHQESIGVASCLESDVNVNGTYKINSKKKKTCSSAPNANSEEGMLAGAQTSENNKVLACSKGSDLKQLQVDKMSEFDPIKQHRHFCPWIASVGGGAPGWQQTLSALLCRKDPPHALSTSCPSSASTIMVDDPIASIRRLFMSPTAKKMKTNHPGIK